MWRVSYKEFSCRVSTFFVKKFARHPIDIFYWNEWVVSDWSMLDVNVTILWELCQFLSYTSFTHSSNFCGWFHLPICDH